MKNHWVKVWSIPWTWKAVEIEAHDEKSGGSEKIDIWTAEVRKKREMDHAGTEVEFRGTRRVCAFRFYDQRHWDHKNDRWKRYE